MFFGLNTFCSLSLSLCLYAALATLRYCPTDTYSLWLSSQNKIGPADLINENATETKQQKYNLSYLLTNVDKDAILIQIELYRFLDEDAINEGWKLEELKTFSPPFNEATLVEFKDLKKGKTYAIHLLATTDIPYIASDGVFNPETISIKTIYYLWDKNIEAHISATSSFGDEMKKLFKINYGFKNCPNKAKIRMRHSDGYENPVFETSASEMLFEEEEFSGWPIQNITSIVADSLDDSGNTLATLELQLLKPPCDFCQPIPCITPSPEDQEDLIYNDKVLENSYIKAKISLNYGGAIRSLIWKGDSRELVDSQDDGVLVQVDSAKANDEWILHGYIPNNREKWEGLEQPPCAKKKATWLPTQGGSQTGCGGQNSSWSGINYYAYNSTTPWGSSLSPAYGTDPNGSYIYYTKDFPNWIPMSQLSSAYDKYKGQAFPVISAEIHLVNVNIQNVSGLQMKSKFRLTCPCVQQTTTPPCWCKSGTPYEYNNYGVYTKGYEFDAIIHIWYFFGSDKVKTTFRYNPQETFDPYFLTLEYPCLWGSESCAKNYGWKDLNDFAPFSLLRTNDQLNGKYVWILIYQVENDSSYTDKSWELARVLRFQSDGVVKGSVHMPFYIIRHPSINATDGSTIPATCTNCGLKTTLWRPSPVSEWITTYIILGNKKNNVLCALYQLSGGKWPKVRSGKPLPCQVLDQGE